MPLRDRVALVSGAAGFVGANLVRRLVTNGATVHAIVRPTTDRWRLGDVERRIVIHTLDLTDAAAVRRAVGDAAPDLVFHLAKHRGTPSALDYRSAYAHNVEATLNLLDALDGRPLQRFVHAGSSLEYALERSPLRESDAPAPRTVHGVTKAAATLLCQQFARTRGVPAVVLRFFSVYGPWEGADRFVPVVMLAALDGRPVPLARGHLVHDRIAVDDVVDACLRATLADDVVGEIINVASGRESTNEDVVRIVEELTGRSLPISETPFEPRSWDATRWVADVTRARTLMGWQASTDLRAGLAATLAWFRGHVGAYRERVR